MPGAYGASGWHTVLKVCFQKKDAYEQHPHHGSGLGATRCKLMVSQPSAWPSSGWVCRPRSKPQAWPPALLPKLPPLHPPARVSTTVLARGWPETNPRTQGTPAHPSEHPRGASVAMQPGHPQAAAVATQIEPGRLTDSPANKGASDRCREGRKAERRFNNTWGAPQSIASSWDLDFSSQSQSQKSTSPGNPTTLVCSPSPSFLRGLEVSRFRELLLGPAAICGTGKKRFSQPRS